MIWQSSDALGHRDLQHDLSQSGLTLISFEPVDAYAAGELRRLTRGLGLFFGDPACLALVQRLSRQVLTADCAWARLKLGIAVEVIG